MRRNTIRKLMIEDGVTFIDPSHAYVSAKRKIGRDSIIYPGRFDRRPVGYWRTLRDPCWFAHYQFAIRRRRRYQGSLRDHRFGNRVETVRSGPFAHLRMNAKLEETSVVGNFVEVKKSRLGRGSKSMHLDLSRRRDHRRKNKHRRRHDHL